MIAAHRPRTHNLRSHVAKPRLSSTQQGYTYRWRKASAAFLKRRPLCVHCESEGRIEPASEVDHIIPHRGDMSLFWDQSNWQPLCKRHHSRKTAAEDGGFGNTMAADSVMPAWLPKPKKKLTIVCGPPAAGKSTYVRTHAKPDDLVIDIDEIAREYGMPIYGRNKEQAKRLVTIRNSRLADFCYGLTQHKACWLIVTAGTLRQRAFWKAYGELVVLHPGERACIERVMARAMRPDARDEVLAAIREWQVDRSEKLNFTVR